MATQNTGAAQLAAAGYATGFANSVIAVYTGARPPTPAAAPTGTLIGYITLGGATFTHGNPTNGLDPEAVDGVLRKPPASSWVLSARADLTGPATCGWARWKTNALDNDDYNDTQPRLDLTIGGSSSTADMRMSNTTVSPASQSVINLVEAPIRKT